MRYKVHCWWAKYRLYIIRICILCRWWQQKIQNTFVQFGSWLCWVHLLLVATKTVPERSHATTCWSSTQMHHLRAVQILVKFSSIWELVWRVGVRLVPLTLLPMNVVLYMNVCNSMHIYRTIYTYSCTHAPNTAHMRIVNWSYPVHICNYFHDTTTHTSGVEFHQQSFCGILARSPCRRQKCVQHRVWNSWHIWTCLH